MPKLSALLALYELRAPVALLYNKTMEERGIRTYRFNTGAGEDDCTFFCLRGADAALVFNEALQAVVMKETRN